MMTRTSIALLGLAWKQLCRHRWRSLLTIAGVSSGVFLFTAVETLQHALREATEEKADDTTLVVYRENRFCPATSRLPEHYLSEIRRISGVREVIPIQIVVNNCGASLDVITFRGVPPETLRSYNPELEVVAGSYESWQKRQDGALLGEHFAQRRGLKPGDLFDAVGIQVYVAGIIRSDEQQDNNVAYVHLPFLQQASNIGLGIVTQFNVRVDHPDQLTSVASAIDSTFASDIRPTDTRPEQAFFAQTAQELIQIVTFSRWVGLGSVGAVLGLVTNSLLLVARGRTKENAILQTIGFLPRSIGLILIWEGLLIGLVGGLMGSLLATAFFGWKRFTLGNEGLTMALVPDGSIAAVSLAVSILLGLLASAWPAFLAAQRPIVTALRDA